MKCILTCSLLSVLLLTPACDRSPHEDPVDGVMRQLRGVKDSVTGLAPSPQDIQDAASQEVNKLFGIEYKVLQLGTGTPASVMEQSLAELGADRWECFSIIQLEGAYMITCRRRPTSYLRYMLKFLPFPLP